MQPHRRQPTRLPHPWDSPGKNTGVGCHFLLQYMKVKSESEVAQSCPTLSDPMGCSLPGSSIHGIFQARVLELGCHCLLQCVCARIGQIAQLQHVHFTTCKFYLKKDVKTGDESIINLSCFHSTITYNSSRSTLIKTNIYYMLEVFRWFIIGKQRLDDPFGTL